MGCILLLLEIITLQQAYLCGYVVNRRRNTICHATPCHALSYNICIINASFCRRISEAGKDTKKKG